MHKMSQENHRLFNPAEYLHQSHIFYQQALSQFQFQSLGICIRVFDHFQHLINEIALVELAGAHIYRNREMGQFGLVRPQDQLLASRGRLRKRNLKYVKALAAAVAA